MGTLEDDVKELILERYHSLAAFAREIDIPDRTLYSALNKGLLNTTVSTFRPIIKTLGLDPARALEGKLVLVDDKSEVAFVPLFDSIDARTPPEAAYATERFPIPASLYAAYPNAFMLRVKGNSMNRVIPNGSYVLISPQNTVDISHRLFAVAVGDATATIKRVISHDNGLTLEPVSFDPTYKSVLFDYSESDASAIAIIGRAVWCCAPLLASA